MDEFVNELNEAGFHAEDYADDLLILITGICVEVLLDLTITARRIVQARSRRVGLGVNPSKT